jgi:DNA-binding PadR family transcriptional regulator
MLLSEWGESDNNRRAKYYTLSVAGKRQLECETNKWSRMSKLVSSMLRVTSVPRESI